MTIQRIGLNGTIISKLLVVLGCTLVPNSMALAEDNGGELNCGAHADYCMYLYCLCELYHGDDVMQNYFFNCIDYDGGRSICQCSCNFGDDELECTTDGVQGHCRARVAAELAPPDSSCGTLWCHLEQELLLLDAAVELAPVEDPDDVMVIGGGHVFVVEPVAEGGLATLVADSDLPTYELSSGTPSGPVDEIAQACTADYDGDGVPDGEFTTDSAGWSCCIAGYGCYSCSMEGGRHCVVECESNECTLDQFFEHYEPPTPDADSPDELSNADGSVTAEEEDGAAATEPVEAIEPVEPRADDGAPSTDDEQPRRSRQDRRERPRRR